MVLKLSNTYTVANSRRHLKGHCVCWYNFIVGVFFFNPSLHNLGITWELCVCLLFFHNRKYLKSELLHPLMTLLGAIWMKPWCCTATLWLSPVLHNKKPWVEPGQFGAAEAQQDPRRSGERSWPPVSKAGLWSDTICPYIIFALHCSTSWNI